MILENTDGHHVLSIVETISHNPFYIQKRYLDNFLMITAKQWKITEKAFLRV